MTPRKIAERKSPRPRKHTEIPKKYAPNTTTTTAMYKLLWDFLSPLPLHDILTIASATVIHIKQMQSDLSFTFEELFFLPKVSAALNRVMKDIKKNSGIHAQASALAIKETFATKLHDFLTKECERENGVCLAGYVIDELQLLRGDARKVKHVAGVYKLLVNLRKEFGKWEVVEDSSSIQLRVESGK